MTPTRIARPVIARPRPSPSVSARLCLSSGCPPRVEQHHRDRPQQDLDIERQGPAAHVLDVQLAHLAVAQPAAQPVATQAKVEEEDSDDEGGDEEDEEGEEDAAE